MTQEEAKRILKIYLQAISFQYPGSIAEAIRTLCEPLPLPSDLDEAAENYIAPIENDEGLDYINFNGRDIEDAFKAGVEWTAGQGICADAKICKLAGRAWVTPINEKQFQRDVYDNFTVDDEVIVQIRKK